MQLLGCFVLPSDQLPRRPTSRRAHDPVVCLHHLVGADWFVVSYIKIIVLFAFACLRAASLLGRVMHPYKHAVRWQQH